MAAIMNGGDKSTGASSTPASGSKQQIKSNTAAKSLEGARKQAASPVDGQARKQQQPKAWQGPNPITQRASSNTPNGTEKPLPKLPAQAPTAKSSCDLHADKHAHDRSIYLLSQFIGKDATITLKNGEQFTGVFSGASLEPNKPQYVIKMARRTKLPSHQQVNGDIDLPHEYTGEGHEHTMSFDVQDTVDLYVPDATMAPATTHQNGSIAGSFMTDTQISARESSMMRDRELQRWEPGPDNSVDMSLESSGTGEWDQFAANEQMYGVKSTYDENIYTTVIDRNNPEYRRRQVEAERIAREIEGSAPATSHVAEERRRDANKDDIGDEEDKYSGVRREAASTLPRRQAGAYVPPSQRPMTGAPTVPGAPFDPAIISAQLARPAPMSGAAQMPPQPSVPIAHPIPANPSEGSKDAVLSTPAAAAPLLKKKENTTEDRVRDTADAFKQFANTEKLRIRQAQEAKRSNARQEKNVKLNDLKKFAANFKLKSRVPDDLVPILAKDREKQMEIQAKAEEAAKEEEVKVKDKLSDKASNVASPPPSTATVQPGPVSPIDQRTPFNHRNRASQQGRGGPVSSGQAPRVPLGQRIQNNQQMYGRQPMQQPADLRIPSGPVGPPSTDMPMSPNSATRLNVNAKSFEFRPGASAFTPTGTTPSPQRSTGSGVGAPSAAAATVSFFQKEKAKEGKSSTSSCDPLKRMAEADYDAGALTRYAPNGGLPQAYQTQPTWAKPQENDQTSYITMFPKVPAASQAPSPMHTPNPNVPMPHAHQLPAHMQPPPAMSTPSHRSQYYQQHGHAPSFDPRMQQHFGPNGSVQSSPRAPQPMPVPFNGQMPPMSVQQFPGQPMPPFGMSPSVQYRQPAMQGGPMMMMPGQPQGQMGPMQPGYPPGGPQFRGPQMGGHMMMQQHSSGGYANGPMPQQGYSPMPPHAQPHMGHMQPHGGPSGYSGSPRPPMMQHQGSHQGYQPGMQMQQSHFASSPGQPHPYHMQRAMSGAGFPQMTPRQQHAVPNHSSPGMAVGQGDEGK